MCKRAVGLEVGDLQRVSQLSVHNFGNFDTIVRCDIRGIWYLIRVIRHYFMCYSMSLVSNIPNKTLIQKYHIVKCDCSTREVSEGITVNGLPWDESLHNTYAEW